MGGLVSWRLEELYVVGKISDRVTIDNEEVARFCQRHRIRKLALFGSILRDDFGPTSDVDVLVEFEPGVRVGLIRLAGIEAELSQMLGRKVDLRSPGDLSRHFRQTVVGEAEVLYARS